jgi:hypothetical protein
MKNYKHLIELILALLWTGHAMAIEEPKYEVLRSDGPYEIRQYAPILIAETLVEGDMDEASNKGFRRIADFIFGNNQAADSAAHAKIAMTAPVTVEPQNDTPNMQSAEQWRVNFVMPSQYTLASIPKPKNSAVSLREVPSKRFVVLKYSGFNTASRVQSKTQEATSWINNNNLKAIGTPQLSRYDPPWTLPMFRRNEIMIEISTP